MSWTGAPIDAEEAAVASAVVRFAAVEVSPGSPQAPATGVLSDSGSPE
jgi:hypothetical protein